ncbi:hypothetical protein RB195_007948 [Necator americanus]|uniref:Tudor domain-containing protein n=1 Tax=Necator americanus TaxID=51031 RepID=A0ABR1BZP5_NECAM
MFAEIFRWKIDEKSSSSSTNEEPCSESNSIVSPITFFLSLPKSGQDFQKLTPLDPAMKATFQGTSDNSCIGEKDPGTDRNCNIDTSKVMNDELSGNSRRNKSEDLVRDNAEKEWGEEGRWNVLDFVDAKELAHVGSIQTNMDLHESRLYEVRLLRFINPNEVYVVPYMKTRKLLEDRLRRWVDDESKNCTSLRPTSINNIYLGLPVLVVAHNHCRRALVQEVNVDRESVTTWFVDHGKRQTDVKLSSLFFMPRAFANIPAQAVECSLGAQHNDGCVTSLNMLVEMRSIAKHFADSWMQVFKSESRNGEKKLVDFYLRERGYDPSSSLRVRLLVAGLASFPDMTQDDVDALSELSPLGSPVAVEKKNNSIELMNTEQEEDNSGENEDIDWTHQSFKPVCSPRKNRKELTVWETSVGNVIKRNPTRGRFALPPVPKGATRVYIHGKKQACLSTFRPRFN